ncbi:MAG: hypothetical protein GTO13_18830 [Proteobacteria bacterium]|nr:hypothetical protein [Pseudomonadota bacterium]
MALEELSGIINIRRGSLDRFEINTVLFDPSRVTVNTMVEALKRANTYIVLLRPVVTEVNGRELSLKVYPNENFYLPPAEGFLIFEWKGEVNPKKGKFMDLSFDEIPPGLHLGASHNLPLNARRVEKSFRMEKAISIGAHRIMVRIEKEGLEFPVILFVKSGLKGLMGIDH